jgi:ribose 5-phosphate isomerase B
VSDAPRFKIAIGSDHAGFALKVQVAEWLAEAGHEVDDVGTHSAERVDYPDFAHAVAKKVQAGTVDRGVLVCGSGIGVSMAANRHAGVRAAHCSFEYQAEMCRRHNDANVLCMGERTIGPGLAESVLATFLTTGFDGGRHTGRVEKIDP